MDAGTCCGKHSAMSAREPLLQRRAHDIRDQIELTGFGCLILTVRERPATARRHKRQGGLKEHPPQRSRTAIA
jgi:hypothetical protein